MYTHSSKQSPLSSVHCMLKFAIVEGCEVLKTVAKAITGLNTCQTINIFRGTYYA